MSAPTATGVSLARTLSRAARSVTVRVEPILKSEALTFDQWLVIDVLAGERGLVMSELAAQTMVTGPTLTRVVDRLVGTAAVYREVDPTDRRRVRVHLSSRGRDAHRRVRTRLDRLERELLDHARASEAVLDTLGRLADPPGPSMADGPA